MFPKATHFYDLLAVECAVSHAALLSGKFKEVHANDITDSVKLFEDALNGDIAKYDPERFRSREDFFAEKDSSPFVRLVYSFGNNQKDYLYSKEREPYKRAVHDMLYTETPKERRLKFYQVIREIERLGLFVNNQQITLPCFMKKNQAEEAVQRIVSLKMKLMASEHNERAYKILANGSCQLNNSGGVKIMSKLKTTIGDYRDVEILPDSVIYVDPPYKHTAGYGIDFGHEAFYDWCEKQTALVLISEYWMPEDRFMCIAEFLRRGLFSATNNSKLEIEKVFVPKHQYEAYKRMMKAQKTQLNLFDE